ncbi:MAG: RNA methyltransferase [candidate division Zixibacteria bacterium]|nr:RNA methyltransferase [candidate division Zixibacteria bacterium]
MNRNRQGKRISFDLSATEFYHAVVLELTAAREKEVRALLSPHSRKKSSKLLVEGTRAVATMLATGVTPDYVICCPTLLTAAGKKFLADHQGAIVYECGAKRFSSFSETEHSQGILAVADREALPAGEPFWPRAKFVLYLDGLADPGNLGTILRTAAAFNVDLVALSPGSADLYSPKVLRASAGEVFLQPTIRRISPETLLGKLKSNSIALYGADADARVRLDELVPSGKVCLAIGSEATGLSDSLRKACDKVFAIRTSSRIESLNAAVAAAIAMSQFASALKTV